MEKSVINPRLTIEYMKGEPEWRYFERKSASKKPSDLAQYISAFANADGGTIAIGISDDGILEGFSRCSEGRMGEFANMPKNCCKPMPEFDYEVIDIVNVEGNLDKILLIHVKPASDYVVRTSNDSTYIRIGDQTKELKGDDLKNLEYSRNSRIFEDEINREATINDLDRELLDEYKRRLDAQYLDDEQVLGSRGFLKRKYGQIFLTNAAVLLFAKNIQQFYPNCRVRFIKCEGNKLETGENYNVVKDISIDEPILRIVDKIKATISILFREFYSLNLETGKFESVTEYPEFAWIEGIVNAVVHRDYAFYGQAITIFMYNDRLEIISPGKFSGNVTVKNICNTRYSRNPKISRVMNEFGWVRELNEGVKRIYKDMGKLFLDAPEYVEGENTITLTLKNNILHRMQRKTDYAIKQIGEETWQLLDNIDKTIMLFITSRNTVTKNEISHIIDVSDGTIRNRLNHLIEMKLIEGIGKSRSPNRSYRFRTE